MKNPNHKSQVPKNSRLVLPRSRGFTLIETMVAVTILTFAVVGPMTVASRAIVATQIARSQLTANYLAQEGIEYIRAMRDNEYLDARLNGGDAWTDFLTFIAQCKGAYACTLDPGPTVTIGVGSGLSLAPCPVGNCARLYLDTNGYNQQNNGTKTQFTRFVQTTSISTTDEKIVSTVSWDFHGATYTVTVTNHLTPWQ